MPRLRRAGHARRAVAALALTGLSVALGGCGKPLEHTECRRLLARYTEFLVREEDPQATPERIARALEEAERAAALDPRFEMSKCAERVRRTSYDCAMSAGSVDAMERCLVF